PGGKDRSMLEEGLNPWLRGARPGPGKAIHAVGAHRSAASLQVFRVCGRVHPCEVRGSTNIGGPPERRSPALLPASQAEDRSSCSNGSGATPNSASLPCWA